MTKEKSGLTKDSTLKELFDFIAVPEGANVMPITLSQKKDDTRLMILVQGEHKIASVIMAQLMTVLQDMSDTVAQAEQEDDKPRIVLPGS